MDKLKIVIPMAGLGSRVRPHTWSKPKQLIPLAGKTLLDHVLAMFASLPAGVAREWIFIIGHQGEQIPAYMAEHYPDWVVHYVQQTQLKGQSHAIYQARHLLGGPMLMVYADTLLETDLSGLAEGEAEALAWVKEHPEPQRFGVAVTGEDGWVSHLVEKPPDAQHQQVVVGFYYFRRSEDLLAAIETQMARDVQLKGEFYLADAVNIMLERGLKMGTVNVDVWLDAGTPQAVLETNRYLLDHGRDNSAAAARRPGVSVIPPVFIHPQAEVQASVVGPHVSLAAGCRLQGSVIRNAVLDEGAMVESAVLQDTMLGRRARVLGRASIINLGDDGQATV